MLSYETLDSIADSVNPALGVLAVLLPIWKWRTRWTFWLLHLFVTIVSFSGVRAFGAFERKLGWWAHAGMDFSTHAAVCLALLVALASLGWRSAWVWVLVFIGYALLMVYQKYHSVADIVTTTLGVLPFVLLLRFADGRIRSLMREDLRQGVRAE